MEYKPQQEPPRVKPRLIIHGGAGNIRRVDYSGEKYAAYRDALISIVCPPFPLLPPSLLS